MVFIRTQTRPHTHTTIVVAAAQIAVLNHDEIGGTLFAKIWCAHNENRISITSVNLQGFSFVVEGCVGNKSKSDDVSVFLVWLSARRLVTSHG